MGIAGGLWRVGARWELRRALARTDESLGHDEAPHSSGVPLFSVHVGAPRNRFDPKRIGS